MEAELVASNPRVAEDRGKIAVRRGPIVYCMEGLDQANGVALSDAAVNINERSGKKFQGEFKAEMLGGIQLLQHEGRVYENSSAEMPLYMSTDLRPSKTHPQKLTFIPYYVWANRQPSTMQVWTPYIDT
jgi:uncharacterized protein